MNRAPDPGTDLTRRRREGPSNPGGASFLLQLVGLVLLGTGALLVWVGVGTVRASRDPGVRTGLDYEVFLDAVSDLLGEAGDSTLLRLHTVAAVIPGPREVTFDTLSVLADIQAFPAFDRAGFLYDQVQAFNRFQRERLALAREYPEWWDRLSAFNPSIFRPSPQPDGSRRVTRTPLAWSLRVQSPLEGDWKGEVRAGDVLRSVGLVGPTVDIPLRKPASLTVPVDDREQLCEFVPSLSETRVYCLSEERIAQATLRVPSGQGEGWMVAGWSGLRGEGQRVSPGDSIPIREGSILQLDPLDPVVFGEYWQGILSSRQWVNGRMQRRNDLLPPLDLFAALASLPRSLKYRGAPEAYLPLSVRAEASTTLTRRLEEFLKEEAILPLEFGMAVIARIPDGRILAVAEVGQRTTRGRSWLLERIAPGSAVKPLLAAAVLSQRPELGDMKIAPRSGSVSSVLGMPRLGNRRAFNTALNCGVPEDGWVDLRYFLRCSNNEFAASLVVAGLSERGVPGRAWNGPSELEVVDGRVPRARLLRSPLSEGLSLLFDVPTDPTIADARRRSRRVWEGLRLSDGTPFEVPFEILPAESRPALLAPGAPEATDLGLLYRYAYGAWENQWTLLDLTNGFARVVSDRRIQMGFAQGPVSADLQGVAGGEGDTPGDDPLGLAGQPWYSSFLSGLRGVGVDGTARGLQEAWRKEGLPPVLFSKTGTLNEPGQPGPADDLFTKSLLFAVGESARGPDSPLECGLVGGLYFRFSEGPRSGALPSYQVEFARRRLGEFLREYWEEFDACSPGSG